RFELQASPEPRLRLGSFARWCRIRCDPVLHMQTAELVRKRRDALLIELEPEKAACGFRLSIASKQQQILLTNGDPLLAQGVGWRCRADEPGPLRIEKTSPPGGDQPQRIGVEREMHLLRKPNRDRMRTCVAHEGADQDRPLRRL